MNITSLTELLALHGDDLVIVRDDSEVSVEPVKKVKLSTLLAWIAPTALQLGIGQTWQDVSGSRAVSTSYQNTTTKPIMVVVSYPAGNIGKFDVSENNSTWVTVVPDIANASGSNSVIVPAGHYYRVGAQAFQEWTELR